MLQVFSYRKLNGKTERDKQLDHSGYVRITETEGWMRRKVDHFIVIPTSNICNLQTNSPVQAPVGNPLTFTRYTLPLPFSFESY